MQVPLEFYPGGYMGEKKGFFWPYPRKLRLSDVIFVLRKLPAGGTEA